MSYARTRFTLVFSESAITQMSIHQERLGQQSRVMTIDSLARRLFPTRPTYLSIAMTLMAFVVAGLVGAIIYLAVVRPTYSATLIIGPTQEQFASTPSSQLDHNALSLLSGGGLLSGPRVITPYDAFLKTLQTRDVAARLYMDPAVRDGLFPGAWDDEKKVWKPQFSIKYELVGVLYWLTGRARPETPTVDSVEQILKTMLGVSMIERGPMYTMTFAATNRDFAMGFLHSTFKIADAIVKAQSRQQVLQRIAALKNRMNSMDVVEYRSQFANLIMDQEKQLLLLQDNTDFAASIIVPAAAPDFPDNPRLFVTIILFAVIFFFLGASVLVLIYRTQIADHVRPRSR